MKRRHMPADIWNEYVPIGSRVLFWRTLDAEPELTRTRSRAWDLAGAPIPTVLVKVQGQAGGVGVDFVMPVPESQPIHYIKFDGKLNLGVFESRYRGPFGRVTGRVAPDGVEPLELGGAVAMGERFWLKS